VTNKAWHNEAPWQGAIVFDLNLALSSPHLRHAARAMSPGLLRIGGTLDKYVQYFPGTGSLTWEACETPVKHSIVN
jgi:hypothetical protein